MSSFLDAGPRPAGDVLKPGRMGSVGDSGTPAEYAGSMAARIESELNSLLAAAGRPTLPDDNSLETRDRRMLFVAIARGVALHLRENADAFVVRRWRTAPVPGDDGVDASRYVDVQVEGI